MRRRRLTFLLLLLFLLPAGLSIYVGVKLARDEQQMQRVQQLEVVGGRLSLLQIEIERFVENYELRLTAVLTQLKGAPNQVRELRRKNPYIDEFFMLDKKGILDFPSYKYSPLSQSETKFVEQTRRIWEDKLVLSARNSDEIQRSRAKSKISVTGQRLRSYDEPLRWHSYFKPEGQALLAFVANRHLGYWGADINMSRLRAELIQWLPEDLGYKLRPGEYISITEADSAPLMYWGEVPKDGAYRVREKLELPSPLEAWHLNFHASDEAWNKTLGSSVFNVTAGVLLFLLVFLLSGVGYYQLQKRELLEAQQRVSFVNQVSHELKTPLTTIRMYAELLEDKLDDDDEPSKEKLRVITRESERLSRLILNILTFGKKEAQKLEIRPTPCNPGEVIAEVVAQHRERLTQKGIAVELQVPSVGLRNLDRDALVQILSNLLSNVEKYAAGASRVVVELCAEGNEIVVSVTDNGRGVPSSELGKIFEAFYRSENELTQTVSGSGIGLHISRELARRHGGDLVAKESSEGASFEVRLRAEAVEESI